MHVVVVLNRGSQSLANQPLSRPPRLCNTGLVIIVLHRWQPVITQLRTAIQPNRTITCSPFMHQALAMHMPDGIIVRRNLKCSITPAGVVVAWQDEGVPSLPHGRATIVRHWGTSKFLEGGDLGPKGTSIQITKALILHV